MHSVQYINNNNVLGQYYKYMRGITTCDGYGYMTYHLILYFYFVLRRVRTLDMISGQKNTDNEIEIMLA